MNFLKRIRPVLAVLGMIAFSAICASAQAEIDPDHFPDPPVQNTSVQKAHAQHAVPAPHWQHASRQAKQENRSRAAVPEPRAHSMSAAEREGVTSHTPLSQAVVQKQHKRRSPEARRHGAS